jgi:hypothetical protein
LAGYLSFAATEKLTLNARIDYLNGSDGTFYDAGGTWFDGDLLRRRRPDTRNELFGLTGTADYALWANVLSRLELRWDTALNDDAPFGKDDKNAFTVTGNVVFVF